MTWAAWMSAISIAIIAKLTCGINNWPSWRCRRKIIYSPPPRSWGEARKSLQMFASRLHCTESPVTTVYASLGIKNFIIINKMTFHSSTIDWAVVKTYIQYIFINLHSSVPLIQPFVHVECYIFTLKTSNISFITNSTNNESSLFKCLNCICFLFCSNCSSCCYKPEHPFLLLHLIIPFKHSSHFKNLPVNVQGLDGMFISSSLATVVLFGLSGSMQSPQSFSYSYSWQRYLNSVPTPHTQSSPGRLPTKKGFWPPCFLHP